MKTILLNNGVEMPQMGYGVFQVAAQACERCVSDAISVGYRSIDTAQIYGNEEGVGAALHKSGLARDEFFVTSKIWINNFGYEKAKASIDLSLRKLDTDYIDLMLIHQPYGDVFGAYRALEEAYHAGKIRAIGLSNFYADRYLDLAHFVEVKPAVNQVETHVFHQQKELQAVMQAYDTKLMSWGPLAEGKNDFFNQPVLKAIGEQYGKSVAQVALRYLWEYDVILIPKSVHKDRMAQNFDIFDFALSADDHALIAALDTKQPLIADHRSERFVNFILQYA